MSITAHCTCGKKFKARDEYAGRRAICTVCRREFVFPLPIAPKQVPPLVEPNPSPASVVEQVIAEENPSLQGSRPWWKDKIIVYGGGVPLLGLAVFLGFLAWAVVRQRADQDRSIPDEVEYARLALVSGFIPADGAQVPRRNPKIPVEVSYPVMDEQRVPPISRIVNIAINMKVPKEILREIALEMKAKEIEQYQRTFIYFYLPEYWDGKDDWATAFFNPTLEVEILGLEEGKDRVLAGLRVTLPENSTLIGSWIAQEEIHVTTIYKRDSKYYLMTSRPDLKKKYPECYSSINDLYELPSTDEPTFTFFPKDEHGLKFRVSKSGTLFKYKHNIMRSIAQPVKNFQVDGSKK